MTSFEAFSVARQGNIKFCMPEKRLSFLQYVQKTEQLVLLKGVYPTWSFLSLVFAAIPLRDPCTIAFTFDFNEWFALVAWGILRRQRKPWQKDKKLHKGKVKYNNLGKAMARKMTKVRKKCTGRQWQEKRWEGGNKKQFLIPLQVQLILKKSVPYWVAWE